MEIAGYAMGTFGGLVWSIANLREQDWLWLVLTVAVTVVAARGLWAVVRQRSASSRAVEEGRRQEAEAAKGAMIAERIRALVEQHHLDVATSSGQIALIRVLREEDPLLGLVDAKNLVDDVRRL